MLGDLAPVDQSSCHILEQNKKCRPQSSLSYARKTTGTQGRRERSILISVGPLYLDIDKELYTSGFEWRSEFVGRFRLHYAVQHESEKPLGLCILAVSAEHRRNNNTWDYNFYYIQI